MREFYCKVNETPGKMDTENLIREKVVLYYCKKHKEWFSQNCSNCMVDDNEHGIRMDERVKVLKEITEAGRKVIKEEGVK